MSRSEETLKSDNNPNSESLYPVNQEAFDFLDKCRQSSIDMTSIRPPHAIKSNIPLPTEVMKALTEVNFDDFLEDDGISRGEDSTLEACTNFFNRNGIICSKESVSLSGGILDGLKHVYKKIRLNRDNKILIPTPTFGYYFKQFKDENIGFEILPTTLENNFLPNLDELEEALSKSDIKALLLCYPNNPTGAILTEEHARNIADIAKRHGVFVISDEAFINNSISDQKHFSIAAVEGMVDHSFTITSAAKSIFMGEKTAFCVSKPDMLIGLEKLGGYPTKRTQRVLTAAIEGTPENAEYFEACKSYYHSNISLIKDRCEEINKKLQEQFEENLTYVKPYIENPQIGGPYLLDFSGLRGKSFNEKIMNTGLDIAKWLLEEAKVGTVPGECFLLDERTMTVRIAINSTPQELNLAFDKISEASEKITAPSIAPRSPKYSSAAKLSNQLAI